MDKAAAEMLGEAVAVSCPAIPTGPGIRVGIRAAGAVAGGGGELIAGAAAA